jgi:serine/threonine-protein kinase
MSTCSKCGTQYATTVRICPRDGTVLEAAGSPDPRITQVLDGKYRLDASLGQGGMGTIYSATHLMLDKPVAVKLIKPDLVTSPDVVRRFQREARAASRLSHPNIAAAYDLGQTDDGTLYIAMELVSGSSLKDVIRTGGRLGDARIIRILRQVTSALVLAHRHSIIHRDLKPHNIMLTTDADGREVAKLLDFGIAKTFNDATQLTSTGFALGTPQYMSPEQALGKEVDGRSDLYSLGVILYEMLTGEVPFNDPSTPAVLVKHMTELPTAPSRRRPELSISPALEAIALRCLEKDPAARFQTADELAAAIESASGTDEVTVRIPPPRLPVPPEAAATVAVAAGSSTAPTLVPTAPTVVPPAPAVMPPAPAVSPTAPTVIPAAPIAPAAATVVPIATAPPAEKAPAPPAPRSDTAAALAAAAGGAAVAAPLPASLAASAPIAPRLPGTSNAASQVQPPSRRMTGAPIVLALLLLLFAGGAYAAYVRGYFGGSRRTEGSPSSPPAASNPAPPSSSSGATPPAAGAPPPAPVPATDPASAATPSAATPTAGASTSSVAASLRAAGPAARSGGSGASGTKPGAAKANAQVAAQPATPAIENPSVLFRCAGVASVCAALRSAAEQSLQADSMVSVRDAARAAIIVDAKATEIDARAEQLFGSTFIVRTYSVELAAARGRDDVPMPAPTTFSFDARVGQEKLDSQCRLIATAAVERIRAFWTKR